MANMYDQNLRAAHGLCFGSGPDESPRWWFDSGTPCEHPEFHTANDRAGWKGRSRNDA